MPCPQNLKPKIRIANNQIELLNIIAKHKSEKPMNTNNIIFFKSNLSTKPPKTNINKAEDSVPTAYILPHWPCDKSNENLISFA